MNFGTRVKAVREAASIQVTQLAKAVGMTYDGIYQLESGRSKEPKTSSMFEIAKALGTSADYLWSGVGTKPSSQETAKAFATYQEENQRPDMFYSILQIDRKSTLPKVQLRKLADEFAKKFASEYGLAYKWVGQTVEFEGKEGLAKGVLGTLDLTNNVKLTVKLPLLLSAMKKSIEKEILEQLAAVKL